MRILLNLAIFFTQCIFSFLLLLFIYLVLVLLDYQGGFDSFIATTVIQPVLGAMISLGTIAICLLIGLPIRISGSINTWWKKNYFISIGSLGIGLVLLVASLFFTQTYSDTDIEREIPNIPIGMFGWIITAFSSLHIFPTENVTTKIENFFNGLFPKK